MTAEEAAERVCVLLREITAAGLEVCMDWDEVVVEIEDRRVPTMWRSTVYGVDEDGRVVDFRTGVEDA